MGCYACYTNRRLTVRQAAHQALLFLIEEMTPSEAFRIGFYIFFLEAINESAGVVENLRTDVVVAREL